MATRRPAYRATVPGALDVNEDLYRRIGEEIADRSLLESFAIPIRSGRAWVVPAGHVCRISTVEGPQVGDFNAWNLHNPRERLWAARTRQVQGAHATTYDRLWSTLPYFRPLLTIVRDTLESYGVDDDGGRVHDVLGTRCDPYIGRILTGEGFDFHCHSNLVRSVMPFGLTEFDVHDAVNRFQVTGINDDDLYFCKPSPARPGDFIEFLAEIDLLCAMSTCPGGDLSIPMWGPDAGDPITVCHPLGVEVYELPGALLQGWQPPPVAPYTGMHGIQLPIWGEP